MFVLIAIVIIVIAIIIFIAWRKEGFDLLQVEKMMKSGASFAQFRAKFPSTTPYQYAQLSSLAKSGKLTDSNIWRVFG